MRGHFSDTHAGHWANLFTDLEEVGIPVELGQAVAWRKAYDSGRAEMLIKNLDALYERRLSRDEIDLLGDVIVQAFNMGRECDGRPLG